MFISYLLFNFGWINLKFIPVDNKELKEEIEAKVRDFYGISLNKDKEKKEKKKIPIKKVYTLEELIENYKLIHYACYLIAQKIENK